MEGLLDILQEEGHKMNFIEESILLLNMQEVEIKFTEGDLVEGNLNQDDLYHLRLKEGIRDIISLVHLNKELSKLEYYINICYTLNKLCLR